MKTGILLFIFFLLFSIRSFEQKANYSHQLVRIGYQDMVQLIANVSSRHHLLVVGPKKTQLLYIFDESLKFLEKRKIPISMPENYEIQALIFKNHYYLFVHVPRSDNYQLWKIDGQGAIQDMSPAFHQVANSRLKDKSATVQMDSDSNHVYLRTQVYYPQLGKLIITLITADPFFNVEATRHVSLPFDKENESLQSLTIIDQEHLLLLKRKQNEDGENLLELMKCYSQSDHIESTQFNIGHRLFSQPYIQYDPLDSSIFIYSMVRESLLDQRLKRSLFICKLNDSLTTVRPPALLRSSYLFSFYLVSGSKINWLHNLDFRSHFYAENGYLNWGPQQFMEGQFISANDWEARKERERYFQYESNSRNAEKIRFSIVDKQFNIAGDSVLQLDSKGFKIHMTNFGKLQWKNKSYLLMEQQLPDKSTGLLLISSEDSQKVDIEELHVYNHYHYLLSQLQQAGNNNAIVPFFYKDQVGLMRLTIN